MKQMNKTQDRQTDNLRDCTRQTSTASCAMSTANSFSFMSITVSSVPVKASHYTNTIKLSH